MKSKSKPKGEIMLASWPENAGKRFRDSCWGSGLDDILSTWLSLRYVDMSDKYSYMDDAARSISDVGIYVWVRRDGTVSLGLRLHEIHSLDLREAEQRLKTLKTLHRKAGASYGLDNFHKTRDVHAEMAKLLDALDIRRTVQYRGISVPETYAPVAVALRAVADEIEAQIKRQGGWKEPKPDTSEAA